MTDSTPHQSRRSGSVRRFAVRDHVRAWLMAGVMLAVTVLGAGAISRTATAGDPSGAQPMSPEMRAIAVDEKRGEPIGRGLRFRDHTGAEVKLGDYFDGERPVIITLNYYRCRVVCSVQLNGMADGLAGLPWTPGDEHFQVVTVSMDPHETSEDAAKKRGTILASLDKGDDVGWAFLTGNELEIRALAAQLGIGYTYDAEQDQYAHPAVANFITGDGRISQYVYGLTFDPLDLRLGIIEAGEGKVGGPVEQLLLSCFAYDHTIGRYGPWAFGIMRIGGVLIVIVLGGFLAFFWRRERRHSQRHLGAQTPAGPGLQTEAEAS